MLQTSSLTGMCSNLEPQDEQAAFPLVMALWWACQDLSLGPHPYQQNAGNRCANGRFRRSRSTVEGEVMCSHRGQLCALIPAAVSPRLNASFSFLPIDVCSTPQYTAIYLLLCSMPRHLDTFASNPQGSLLGYFADCAACSVAR